MADRFNIKFTIQAVDRFSAVMTKLERKLDSLQSKADKFDINKDVSITADTAQALNELSTLNRKVESLDRAASKQRKIKFKTEDAQAELGRMGNMIRGLAPTPIDIDVNTRGAMTNLRRVDDFMDDLRTRNREIRTSVEIETGGAMRSLQRIATQSDRFASARRTAELNINTLPATSALRALNQVANNATREREIDVGVDLNGALARMAELRAATQAIDDDAIANIEVDADIAPAVAQLSIVEQIRQRVGRPVIIDILVRDYTRFRNSMDRIATTGRNVGEIVTNVLMGLATTFSTVLIPVIASTTGAIGSMGVMIGVASGASMGLVSSLFAMTAGVGGFVAVAIPAISKFQFKMKEISELKMAIDAAKASGDLEEVAKLTKNLQEIQDGLTTSQKKTQMAMAELSETYGGLSSALEPGVLMAYGKSMIGLNTILEMSSPMITATVDAVNRLVEAFNKNLKTEDVIAFFEYLNGYGAAALQVMVKALGNFLMGIFNLMVAFAPLSTSMQGGFLAMSEGFRAWTAALGENSKFQAFVAYVRANWPAVRTIIGTAIAAIIETFAGFSAYATEWMATTQALIDKWRAFAQGMGENAKFQEFISYIRTNAPIVTGMLGNLIEFLVALGVALAPVGSVMVEFASAMFQMFTNILQANPQIGVLLGWILTLGGGFFTLLPIGVMVVSFFTSFMSILTRVVPAVMRFGSTFLRTITSISRMKSAFMILRAVMMMLGGPIAWIIGILLLLVPVFIRLWQTSEQFRTIVTAAFEAVKAKIMEAVNAIVSFVMSTWGTLVAYWEKNGEMIKQASSNVWSFISTIITGAMAVIGAIMKAVWPVIQFVIVSVWNNIKGVISGALTFIMGLVTFFSGMFTGNWSAMWEGIKQMFKGAFTFLWNLIQLAFFGKILKGFLSFAALFTGGIRGFWTRVQVLFSTSLATIKRNFTTSVTAIQTTSRNIFNSIKTTITNVWTAIKTKVTTTASNLKTAIVNAFNNIKTSVTTQSSYIKAKIVTTWNSIKTSVSTAVSNILTAVRTKFDNILTAVRTKMTSAKTTIMTAWTNIKTSVSTAMSNILTTVRTKFTNIVTAARTKMSEAKTAVVNKWNEVMSFLRGIDLAGIGRNIIEGLIGGIKSMGGKLVSSAKGVVEGAINGAKKLLGIKSPSRVFRSIGEYTMMGMKIGIESEAQRTINAVSSVADRMTNAFAPKLDANLGVNGGYGNNSYSAASSSYASTRASQAKASQSRTVVEVPVYLNGREIAKASNNEQNRMNAREKARTTQFSRTGGAQ